MIAATTDAPGTEQIGAQLAQSLDAGDVILLSGDLGSGKTTLVRGAVRSLGVRTPVTSPTFAIANSYPVTGGALPGLRAISHLDLYRLGDLGSEDPDLLADYIRADAISFVEWPSGAEETIAGLGVIRYRVTLAHAGGDQRRIEVISA